ncbi:hypothetical protein Glove_184g30 [Diversispora epigaea]|uniref:Uncharacterized protein n=1 Tax=Diversispora epigaea TaxID=1348612 RepID=A0A397ITZ7_9GLOM|nr:hypothetical protein Glove_184g30 [Diversispora epigaea]
MRTEPSEMTSNIRKRPRSTMPELSKKWWLLKKTTCAALDLNSWSESLKKRGHKSWFSIQMVKEKTPPKRLKSSKNEEKKPSAGKCDGRIINDLRARCINVENFKNDTKLKWVIETPYPIRDEAMRDLLKGYSSNFASNKKFRSKKDPRQSIVIHSQHWGRSRGEYSFHPKIKSAEPLPEKLGYDSRLVMNCLGEFYLCILSRSAQNNVES